jgi:hypothetical protein
VTTMPIIMPVNSSASFRMRFSNYQCRLKSAPTTTGFG